MKVLIAPLDWGLGHAARCVPVIREFLRQGAEVELAVVKANANFFREIFPDVRQRIAPSYNIVYPKHGFNMALWLLKNSGHLNKVMRFEHRYAEEMVERHGYDVLFSDNRFAFYSKKAYCIYMTHQRRIAFPRALSKFENVGIKWHAKLMKKFDEVWVPDLQESPGYAGPLSHLEETPANMHYVGALSRFSTYNPVAQRISDRLSKNKNIGVVAVVSGVEPARTEFEDQLRESLSDVPGHHVMILGQPSATRRSWTEGNIEFYSHLPMEEFADAVRHAKWVVSRGGYSTIMDMAVLDAKCICVPTPGQYEQIMLAQNLEAAGYAAHIPAQNLTAETMMDAFKAKVALPPPPPQNLLQNTVVNVFASCKAKLRNLK
ncbi:MAG: glycosyl transferase family 28 [Fibrobacter sp.]|nr:glycosyl transferase family 28 [Fibrobacter sp.]